MVGDRKVDVKAKVASRPGQSTQAIANELGLHHSTATYHLDRLLRDGEVTVERVGRERHWYHRTQPYCPVLRKAIPALRREDTLRVADDLLEEGRTVAGIAARQGLSMASARWATHLLRSTGIIADLTGGHVTLREGAQTCIRKAIAAKPCALWGECAVSKALAPDAATSAPSPCATEAGRDRSSDPPLVPSSG